MTEHFDDAVLEGLALGRLSPAEAERAMLHINACEKCRGRFVVTKNYVETMRDALRKLNEEQQD